MQCNEFQESSDFKGPRKLEQVGPTEWLQLIGLKPDEPRSVQKGLLFRLYLGSVSSVCRCMLPGRGSCQEALAE